mgnify:CR=1 FL=1
MIMPTPAKKFILFAYDRKEYESSRGMYETIDSYPFDYTEKAEEVIPFAHCSGGTPDNAFMQKYASYEDGHGAERSVVRSSFMRTAAVNTGIMAMVKKVF